MGGSIIFHQPANRYYVSIYWQGKRYKIWKYNNEPIWHDKTAEKLLNKIRAEIDNGTFNVRSYFPESPLALAAFGEQWLRASTACNNTKRVYRTCLKRIVDYFGKDFDIRHFTHSKLQIFYNELPLTEKGKYNVMTALKTLLNYAYKDELISRVPPFPALYLGLPENIAYLTYEQQQKVLSAIPEYHRPIFEFMMEYGLRIGEATALMKDCVTETTVDIKRSFSASELRETTKTGKIRRYGLTDTAAIILRQMFNQYPFSQYIFCRSNNGEAYTPKDLNCIWKAACKASGIEIRLYNAVRHSLGCQLLDEGHDMEMVRDVLGHTATNTTRRYAMRSQHTITHVLNFRGHLEAVQRQKTSG